MSNFSYKTITKNVEAKLTEKNSRFIAIASSVKNEEEVKAFLEDCKKQHPKASHHCYAYRLGIDKNNYRANDDGEPSGSAGRPILGQIDSFGLSNVVIDVIRYYGGVNLGVSGLIKAYKGAAKLALEEAKVIKKYITSTENIEIDYLKINDFQTWLNQQEITILKETYQFDKAEFELQFYRKDEESIKNELKNYRS